MKAQEEAGHRIVLKKHHKWMIGGISAVVVIYMVVSIILISGLAVKQTSDYNKFTNEKMGGVGGNSPKPMVILIFVNTFVIYLNCFVDLHSRPQQCGRLCFRA